MENHPPGEFSLNGRRINEFGSSFPPMAAVGRLCSTHVLGLSYVVSHPQVETQTGRESLGIFKKIDFDDFLELSIPMRLLPRESAIYVTLYGINREDANQRMTLGWFALNLFSSKRELIQGTKLCPFWGPEVDQMSGPPCCSDSPSAPLLSMHFTEFDHIVFFPKVSPDFLILRRSSSLCID